jgi:hypothetical protein
VTLGEGAEDGAEGGGVGVVDLLVEGVVGLAPDGVGPGEQVAALSGEEKDAAAAVFGIGVDFHEAAALEGLEGGGEGGAAHDQELGDWRHGRRLGAVESDEDGELAVGEAEGAEGHVEAASEGTGGALNEEAEAAVADLVGDIEGEGISG